MIENHRVNIFIFAKGTSSRIVNKNLQMLGNLPLFCHAITNALSSKYADKIIIDSEDEKILKIGYMFGATKLKRPDNLATNKATGDDLVYWEASNCKNNEHMVSLSPCSPFISADVIDKAIEILNKDKSSVFSAYKEVFYEWRYGVPVYYEKNKIPNSFDMEPLLYETTGMYANRVGDALKTHKRINVENCFPLIVTKLQSIDINTYEDLEFARIVHRGLNDSNSDNF